MSFSNVSKICDFDFTLEINYYTWPISFVFELIWRKLQLYNFKSCHYYSELMFFSIFGGSCICLQFLELDICPNPLQFWMLWDKPCRGGKVDGWVNFLFLYLLFSPPPQKKFCFPCKETFWRLFIERLGALLAFCLLFHKVGIRVSPPDGFASGWQAILNE